MDIRRERWWDHAVHSRVLVSLASLLLLACGSSPPPKTASEGSHSSESTPSSTTGDSESKPATSSKYPEIFLEPDCGSVQADGYLGDKSVISKVQDENRSRLEACLDGLDNASGEVRVSFRLDPDGVPRCVEAPGSTVADEDVIRCVVHVYRSFHYPPPQNGSVHVTDKFSFEISEEED